MLKTRPMHVLEMPPPIEKPVDAEGWPIEISFPVLIRVTKNLKRLNGSDFDLANELNLARVVDPVYLIGKVKLASAINLVLRNFLLIAPTVTQSRHEPMAFIKVKSLAVPVLVDEFPIYEAEEALRFWRLGATEKLNVAAIMHELNAISNDEFTNHHLQMVAALLKGDEVGESKEKEDSSESEDDISVMGSSGHVGEFKEEEEDASDSETETVKTKTSRANLVNPVFAKIVSIGYEIETHDFAKLTRVIRTDDPTIYRYVNFGQAEDIDFQHSKLEIDGETYLRRDAVSHPYPFALEFISEFDKDGESVDKNIKFEITNEYSPRMSPLRKKSGKSKPKYIQIKDGKEYINVNLSNGDNDQFQGVEWIVTYKNPRQHASIIADTFSDACKFVRSELSETEKNQKRPVSIYFGIDQITRPKKVLSTYMLCNVEKNVSYLRIKNPKREETIFRPQMTFGCKVGDAYEIISAMLDEGERLNQIKEAHKIAESMMQFFTNGITIERLHTIKGYLFLVLYVLKRVAAFHEKEDEIKARKEHAYEKSQIYFLPRATLRDMVEYIPDWNDLTKHYKDMLLAFLKGGTMDDISKLQKSRIYYQGPDYENDITNYKIENDVVLIEDRGFRRWFIPNLRTGVTLTRVKRKMKRIPRANLRTHRWFQDKYRRKCNAEEERIRFKCVKMRSTKKTMDEIEEEKRAFTQRDRKWVRT